MNAMTDITTLINELRSNAAVYKGFLEADGIRLTRGIALQARAADALAAQEAKITEALAAIEPPAYYEAKPHKALRDLEYVRRILSADAPTEPLIECPHWEPGRITLRKGCTACEADAPTVPTPRVGT